ncbi:MAG: addiction module protein [Rhodoferax sp.]|jgi:putative addiction module component (TIGR02574 family)|uniref:addiction module protein n=1 Tax=Rhodoferax sp. TaxID=50421 RepID=UPI003BAFE183
MNATPRDFKTLPLSERIQLVEDIWDSIAEETAATPFFVAEDVAEFHQRLAAHQKEPASSVPWDEVRTQLFKAPR